MIGWGWQECALKSCVQECALKSSTATVLAPATLRLTLMITPRDDYRPSSLHLYTDQINPSPISALPQNSTHSVKPSACCSPTSDLTPNTQTYPNLYTPHLSSGQPTKCEALRHPSLTSSPNPTLIQVLNSLPQHRSAQIAQSPPPPALTCALNNKVTTVGGVVTATWFCNHVQSKREAKIKQRFLKSQRAQFCVVGVAFPVQ